MNPGVVCEWGTIDLESAPPQSPTQWALIANVYGIRYYHIIFDCFTDKISYVGCLVMPFLGGHGQGSSRGA